MLSKCGAIFEVDAALIIRALQFYGALPEEAVCEIANDDTPLLVKVRDEDGEYLPVVPEGGVFPRRRAVPGRPWGEKIKES